MKSLEDYEREAVDALIAMCGYCNKSTSGMNLQILTLDICDATGKVGPGIYSHRHRRSRLTEIDIDVSHTIRGGEGNTIFQAQAHDEFLGAEAMSQEEKRKKAPEDHEQKAVEALLGMMGLHYQVAFGLEISRADICDEKGNVALSIRSARHTPQGPWKGRDKNGKVIFEELGVFYIPDA